MNRGVQELYYTRDLPARSVAIAQIKTVASTPAELTDVTNTPYLPASLGIWKSTTAHTEPADFVAPDYGQSKSILGSSFYRIENQYFELTNVVSASGAALYYMYALPVGVTDVKILDLQGLPVTADILMVGNVMYHDLGDAAYHVRYVQERRIYTRLLRCDPVLLPAQYAPGLSKYVYSGSTLQVVDLGAYQIRFTAPAGYLVRPAYNSAPNAPWFPRICFSMKSPPPEWARQSFLPQRPYMLASWVPGEVLSPNVIEFERKHMYDDPLHLPDIIIFDKDHKFKYALEGTPQTRRGSLYQWKRNQVRDIDPTTSRMEVKVDLALDDLVFGFYPYREFDVVYTALDVNPFTNPDIKSRVVNFFYRKDSDPFRVIYHAIMNLDGTIFATNDPNPITPLPNVFAQMCVGASVSIAQVEVVDARVRGGGLAPQYQDIPEAVNFWDIGYWDGKPYPIGGALVTYLPKRILDVMSRADVQGKVEAVLPLGTAVVIHFYDVDGTESV